MTMQLLVLGLVVGERVQHGRHGALTLEGAASAQLRLRIRDVHGPDFVDMFLDRYGLELPSGA
jgi:hypothetical protein